MSSRVRRSAKGTLETRDERLRLLTADTRADSWPHPLGDDCGLIHTSQTDLQASRTSAHPMVEPIRDASSTAQGRAAPTERMRRVNAGQGGRGCRFGHGNREAPDPVLEPVLRCSRHPHANSGGPFP